jgi:DNA modification methylase/ParB-like chromosome segregation protein Spo0J
MPELVMLPLELLRLSRFNARRHRPPAQVTRLAARMKCNGFEVTRALWVYAVDGHYEVFAGGTRLAAAQEAGLAAVPVLVYPADDEEQISRLADEDNENDEYHVPVPLPDVWAAYQRLSEKEGWSQRRIAHAKGVALGLVNARLAFARFPAPVLEAFNQPILKEDHARELEQCSKFERFEPWLTRHQVLCEIVATVLEKHRGSSAAKAPTATVFRKYVETYNQLGEGAQKALALFPAPFPTLDGPPHDPGATFLETLHQHTVRTVKDITLWAAQEVARCRALQRVIEEHHARQVTKAQAEQARLEAEQRRHAERDRLLRCLQYGDCRDLLLTQCPEPIQLVLTDPPYGIGFQSKRRVTTARKPRLVGDQPREAATRLREMLVLVRPKLAANAHLLFFTHADSYCAFQQVLTQAGFGLRRTMTWDKGTHGLGDTTRGEVLTQTEWIIHAVWGNPKFEDDVPRPAILTFPVDQASELPAEKPLALLTHLITLASPPGALVVDPFAGSGHTLLAALDAGRQGWACEVEKATYDVASQRLYAYVEEHLYGSRAALLATG